MQSGLIQSHNDVPLTRHQPEARSVADFRRLSNYSVNYPPKAAPSIVLVIPCLKTMESNAIWPKQISYDIPLTGHRTQARSLANSH